MPFLGLIILVVVLIAFYIFAVYNKFVKTKTRIKASIQEIGNQLKRQANLIPNLTQAVKGYLKHEKGVFNEITKARTAVTNALKTNDTQKLIDAGSKLQSALGPIRAVFESTPELQAAKPTEKLMDELRDTADKLAYSRRTLIDLTADYNIMVVSIPSKFVAGLFGFKQEPGLKTPAEGAHLEVTEEETKSPKVAL